MSVLFLFFFFSCSCFWFVFFFNSVNLTCSEVVLPISRISISPFTLHAPGLLQVPDIILEIAVCGLEDDLLLVCYSLFYLLTFLLIIIYIVSFFFIFTPYCIMTLLVFTSIATVLPMICKLFHYNMK